MNIQEQIEQEKRSMQKLLDELKEKFIQDTKYISEQQQKEKVRIENLLNEIKLKFKNSDTVTI